MKNLRDYGLPDADRVGVPRITEFPVRNSPPCPNCGCKSLAAIEIDVEIKLLKGGKGIGRYLGCPACPFASPMISTSG